ncbi:MAG: hypothetical protein GJU76_04195, partial [Gallionella sp.]|nr:hypothetical protein [Gallionella sp.]
MTDPAHLSKETMVTENATAYLGDCRELLPRLDGIVAHHVITDPPFDAEAHAAQRRVLGKGISKCRDLENQPLPFAPLDPDTRAAVLAWSAYRCSGWFIAFCQTEAIGAWRASLEAVGIRWRRAGIWVKPDGSP